MSLRVLCVTPWFPNVPSEGWYNFIFHSVRALREAGHGVSVLVTRPWVPGSLARLSDGWSRAREPLQFEQFDSSLALEVRRYVSIPRYILSEYADGLYRLGIAGRIRQIIRERRIQLVHAHTERAGITAVAVAREFGVPSVVTLHGISTAPRMLDSATKRARLRRCLNDASRVVLVGEALRAHFLPIALRDDNFRVVPNGFFLHGVTRTTDRPGGAVRFVSVSNLHEGKGIDLNLEALARLDATGLRDWTYAVVGSGALRESLERTVERLALGRRVTFYGSLAHDAAMRVLADGDVFVLPSYREAFGVAYVEAMACGLLTVGVEGQGPDAFITSGQTGLLVKPRDVESLYRAMRLSWDAPDDAARIAAAGQAHASTEFTWTRHAEKLTAVYEEALGT